MALSRTDILKRIRYEKQERTRRDVSKSLDDKKENTETKKVEPEKKDK